MYLSHWIRANKNILRFFNFSLPAISLAMAEGMLNPMYKTILMSATMPRAHQLPTIVDNFLSTFATTAEASIKECYSTQLDRGVILVRPSGHIAFPHELCHTSAQLKALADRLPGDPLTLKAYTERALAQLLVRWRILSKQGIPPSSWQPPQDPKIRFKDLSFLKPESIREYTVELLQSVAAADDDRFAKEFCSVELSPELVKKEDTDAIALSAPFPKFDLKELLFSNAHAFPGISLVADDRPCVLLEEMAERLIEQFPKISALDADLEAADAEQKRLQKLAEKEAAKGGKDDEGGAGIDFGSSSQQKIQIDSSLILHTESFLKRWCPSHDKGSHFIQPRQVPHLGDYKTISDLPVDDKWKMLALSGAAAFDPMLDRDPAMPIYTQFVHDQMQRNKLSCVTAGKEFTWGANLPASTVVVTSSFAKKTSVSGMLQYVGRAARRGLTTHGQALFETDEDLDRIFRKGSQQMSTEADTMERYAKWIVGGKTDESWTEAGKDTA